MTSFDQDKELYYQHIQDLSSLGGIIRFFEYQGYTIDQKTFESEKLLNFYECSKEFFSIFADKRIERIVRHDDDISCIEIYVFEFQQIKRKEFWHQLVKCFRYRDNCNYLFVLARKHSRQKNYR